MSQEQERVAVTLADVVAMTFSVLAGEPVCAVDTPPLEPSKPRRATAGGTAVGSRLPAGHR